ncbi:hypothetical protein SO802_032315 [Lithocarpus litseifolius]|uniref:F-box associated beta-propeller type 1 domain-containing protein n=1 Tax=Lithocarpus litseifolius TaxID=425828 RepID=A0AAW2BRG0_9ROSI
MSFEDSLETYSCCQTAFDNELPKGTTSTRGRSEFIYLLIDFPLSYSERLCRWNPCVRKLVNLPSPSATYTGFLGFGFGFDPKIKDYRVVRFVTSEDRLDLANPQPEVEVYSLSTDEWRVIRNEWLMTDFNLFVLVFNLADEVFRDIQLPPELPDTNENNGDFLRSSASVYGSVYVHGNSISYSYEKQYICHDGHGRRHFILWVMKEYGVASSWTPYLLQMLISERSCQGQLVLRGMGMLYSYLVKDNLSLGI